MKSAVLHFGSFDDRTSPNIRISRFVSETLNVPLITEGNIHNYAGAHFNVLFVKFALRQPPNWESFFNLYHAADLIVVLENDYMATKPKWLECSKMNFALWTTIPSRLEDRVDHYVNWNCLPFPGAPVLCEFQKPIFERTLFYYGAFRLGREADFIKYMTGDIYPVHFSNPPATNFMVERLNRNIIQRPMFDSAMAFQQYGTSLYLQDDESHRLYCSPPNRFYEAIQFGLALYIDEKCVDTLERAKIDTDSRSIVANAEDLATKIPFHDKIRRGQRRAWARDFVAETRQQLLSAHSKICK